MRKEQPVVQATCCSCEPGGFGRGFLVTAQGNNRLPWCTSICLECDIWDHCTHTRFKHAFPRVWEKIALQTGCT